eukprot:13799872-Alexandrium_andersonii.AAC.1
MATRPCLSSASRSLRKPASKQRGSRERLRLPRVCVGEDARSDRPHPFRPLAFLTGPCTTPRSIATLAHDAGSERST